ncbi:MAG: DUF4173 domain-containing protein [Gemmatimonadaceae bacterium]|nr:DUF4173 domain-containing protein [Gemmatimonadaceae bacterium]
MTIPATRLLLAALLAGISGDYLLRGNVNWRLGFAVWITIVVVIAMVLDREGGRERRFLLAGIAAAAFGLVLRDAQLLYAVDFGSLLAMGILTIWHGSGRRLADLTVVEGARAGILAAVNTIAGAVGVVSRTSAERSAGADSGRARALLVGVVLAVPPLLVVTGLLAASDKVFEHLLDTVGKSLAADTIGHLLVILLVAWITAGWFRAATGNTLGASVPAPASPGLRFASVAVPLYSLVALLSLFLLTQARVLFGGAAFLRETAGLTVANYAREGFFQLILASVIVLGTLVVAEWLMNRTDAPSRRHFHIAGAILLALVMTLLVSAATRIGIYVGLFGHSMDRMFAMAAIVFVLAVLVTCGLTTLRGRPGRFAPSVVGVAIGWVVVLNLMNPEALVVRANVARAQAGAEFDVAYHAALSADALPVLVSQSHRLAAADCRSVGEAARLSWHGRSESYWVSGFTWRGLSVPLLRASRWYRGGGIIPCAAAPG